MNEDKLKEFIREHRHAFDRETPDAHGWKGLEHMFARLKTADTLEQYVLHHRILLDTELPNDCIWQNIEESLNASTYGSADINPLPAYGSADINPLPAYGEPSAGKPSTVHRPPLTDDCDPLEQFIRVNRDGLDEALPDLRVWAAIEQEVPEAPQRRAKILRLPWQRSLLRVAAAVTLLLTGMGLGLWYGQNINTNTGGMAMSDLSDEYAELEQYYQRDIAGKQVKLASFTGSQPDEVQEDLAQMDNMMNELRKDLAGVPPGNREQVVRAMIENYKAKSSILQRVLEHLDKSKTETNNSGKKHEIEHI